MAGIEGRAVPADNLFYKYKGHIEHEADEQLRKAGWFYGLFASGKITRFPGSRRGNSCYGSRIQNRLDSAIAQLRTKEGTLLFITLTAHYDVGSIGDIFDSWRRFREHWGTFRQWLKRNGFTSFIRIYEAHENGGCHGHLIIYYDKHLETKAENMTDIHGNVTYRLADKELEKKINEAWKRGFTKGAKVDVKVAQTSGAINYINKELGKSSHIEKALQRSKRDWTADGDMEHKSNDIKKLWAYWISLKLNMNRWQTSRDLKANALDNTMTNSHTDIDRDILIDYCSVPYSVLNSDWFIPEAGTLDASTYEFKYAADMFHRLANPTEPILDISHIKAELQNT